MTYKYEELDCSRQQIRLLHILPGQNAEPIHCSLVVESLRDILTYETLSYAWGDVSDTAVIYIDNCPMLIGKNLESALRELRHLSDTLIIWVDAICIQQKNTEEKNHQVMMMASIYKRCSRAYVWLGSGCSQSPDSPQTWIHHFGSNRHWYELSGYDYDSEAQIYYFGRDDDASTEKDFNDFSNLALSPWWSRIWTTQEASLAPEVVLVQGRWRAPWELLERGHDNRIRHRWSCCTGAESFFPKPWTSLCNQLYTTVNYITRNRRNIAQGQHYPFHQTVFVYAGKKASNPRDKIIGLLGLANPLRYHFTPDYAQSIPEVFTQAFRAMIEEDSWDLRCLTGPRFGTDYPGLPSWVPDFSEPVDFESSYHGLSRLDHYYLYNASGAQKPELQHDSAVLRLRGRRVGTVCRISDPERETSTSGLSVLLSKWLLFAESQHDHHAKSRISKEEFWRTVAADVIYVPQVHNVDDDVWERCTGNAQDFVCLEEFLGDPLSPPPAGWIVALEAAVFGRAMFSTEQGSIGLCSPKVRIGDEVWVLYGSRVPFVLRPSEKTENKYRFVGDCYLHGAMDGEAIVAEDAEDTTLTLV